MSKPEGLLNRHFRLFLFVAVFVAVVYLIVRNISAFGNILLVALGFGAVVLVHEFGHFVVAKLSDIKVEAFSIGFPPVLAGILRTEDGWRVRILPQFFPGEAGSGGGLLSFTIGRKAGAGPVRNKPGKPDAPPVAGTSNGAGPVRNKPGKPDAPPVAGTSNGAGETEYRIGLIPFGGFVKMLGQDDTGPVKASDDPRSYANKPVSVRMAVITAGVVFNAISAVIVFMIVFLIGINRFPAVVGGVMPDTPAARAGLMAGDEIIEIAGRSDNLEFSNIGMAAALSGRDEKVALKVKRRDGSVEDFAISAEKMQTPMGEMRLFGVLPPRRLTIAGVSEDYANTLFEKTGLMPGDRIKAINGRDVQTHWELVEIVQNAFVPTVTVLAERIAPVSKEVELTESRVRLTLNLQNKKDKKESEGESDLGNIYSMVPRLRISEVLSEPKESDAEPYLRSGDIILAVGEVDNPTYSEMRSVTTRYEDSELAIKVLRLDANGVEKLLTVIVVPRRSKDKDRVVIGIGVELDFGRAVVAKTISVEDGPAALAIPRGAAITAVGGVAVSNFYDVAREIGQYSGQRITIDYRLDEKTAGDVALDVGGDKGFVPVKCTFAEIIPFKPLERLYKASGPVDAIVMGYRRTIMFIAQAYVTLQRVVLGLVSPKSFIGPIGIVTLSYRIVAERPLIHYVYFLGLISAFIAVFNFLPLPPFDGGHIVLLLVEKVKGSALSERTQGAITYAGLALIGAFFLYVTFNDIVRSFFR